MVWRRCFKPFFPFFVCFGGIKRGVGGKGLGCFRGGGGLESTFFLAVSDWEMEIVERFLVTLQGKKVVTNMEDRV